MVSVKFGPPSEAKNPASDNQPGNQIGLSVWRKLSPFEQSGDSPPRTTRGAGGMRVDLWRK
jgi:hypothetical protein